MTQQKEHAFKSGFVAIVGRPNIGKSSLINRIMAQELAIVTPKQQTTRNRISAIYSTDSVQIIFMDTPGFHDPKTLLNKSLVAVAKKTVEDAEIVVFMVAPDQNLHEEDLQTLNLIKALRKPCILVINKIDLVERQTLLPVIESWASHHDFQAVLPLSVITGLGIDDLMNTITNLLPESPMLFPEDDISNLPTRFFVAEMVREQIITQTGQEIPYKTAVVVESFQEETNKITIHADIHVERDSQKKIIVGKQGAMIKLIGTNARKKIEDFLQARVRLELFVKVTPNWTKKERMLEEFGYTVPREK